MRLEIPYSSAQLPNGLTVLLHEDHRTPVVCVNIWYFVGSKDEKPGRTGFAHLFEHLMFEGSAHVPKGQFDKLLEEVGGTNNGSTSPDRTNYWETVPSTALELALYLESDRMGWFLETITQEKLDGQRDVVKNERRQSYENRPYGLAYETIMAAIYPPDHPYHWPVIGWMPDLDAATLTDVRDFFRTFYTPRNAAIALAGDVNAGQALALVERYFGNIGGPAVPAGAHTHVPALTAERFITLEDEVHLPRLYLTWHSPPLFAAGDAEMDVLAEILGGGKAARLYRRLVHDLEIAQDVEVCQNSAQIASTFMVSVTARQGVGLQRIHDEVRNIMRQAASDLSERELARARHHLETAIVDAVQSVGGFGGKADRLNHYYFYARDPGFLARDLARYRELRVDGTREALARMLDTHAVVLSVVPRAKSQTAVTGA